MKAFAYERAGDAVAAVPSRRRGCARYLGGGTNLVDLMKLGVAEPERLVDVSRLPLDGVEPTERRAADRRRRAQQRPRRPPARARALPGAVAGAARGRLGSAAQPRHRRRQPAPAHALLVLPGRHQAVQQARPGLGLPGARGRAPQPRDPRPLRALRGHPPVGHGGRARRDRRHRRGARHPTASARSRCPACTGSPATAPSTTRCSTPATSSPPSSCRPPAPRSRLPQGPRPRLVRVRARLRRRRGGGRGRHDHARRGSALGRCQPRAVAGGDAPSRRCRGAPATAETFAAAAAAELEAAQPAPRQRVQGAAGPESCSCARSRS